MLCTTGKKENLYIKEFIEHYKKYGVDKIIIYDNNEKNDEYFDEVISEYINSKFVKIINFRGRNKIQLIAMNDCYKKNYMKYDWILFYDIDEFIFLKDTYNIKKFLNQRKFNKCQVIQLNWVQHTDNEKLYYENKSIFSRFNKKGKKIEKLCNIKSILRGKISTKITSAHFINFSLNSCDGFGHKKKYINFKDINPDYNYYYIDHFYSKSTEEFANKILRGSVAYGKAKRINIIKYYFELNKITIKKINYLEKILKVNLSVFRKKIIE